MKARRILVGVGVVAAVQGGVSVSGSALTRGNNSSGAEVGIRHLF